MRFSRKFRVQNSSNTFNTSRSWGNQASKAENVTFRMFTFSSTVYYIGVQCNLGTCNNLWANPCSQSLLVMLKSFWFILPFKDLLCARGTWWTVLCPEVDIGLQVYYPNWGYFAININPSLIYLARTLRKPYRFYHSHFRCQRNRLNWRLISFWKSALDEIKRAG